MIDVGPINSHLAECLSNPVQKQFEFVEQEGFKDPSHRFAVLRQGKSNGSCFYSYIKGNFPEPQIFPIMDVLILNNDRFITITAINNEPYGFRSQFVTVKYFSSGNSTVEQNKIYEGVLTNSFTDEELINTGFPLLSDLPAKLNDFDYTFSQFDQLAFGSDMPASPQELFDQVGLIPNSFQISYSGPGAC